MVLVWTGAVLLTLVLLVSVTVIVAPLRLAARCAYRDDALSYSVDFWWLHRALVHGRHGSDQSAFSLRVLAWRFPRAGAPEAPTDEQETMRDADGGEEPSEPVPPDSTSRRPYDTSSSDTAPTPPPAQEALPDTDEDAQDEAAGATADTRHQNPVGRAYRRLRLKYEKLKYSRVLFVLRQDGLRRKLLRCLGGAVGPLVRVVVLDRVRIAVRASAYDPSTLGILSGALMGVSRALATRSAQPQVISFEPVFHGEALEADTEIVLRTSMGRLTAPAIRVLLTFPYLSALLVYLRVRRMGRK